MGRSVRVAAIAAAMLFTLPAAAFADTGAREPGVAPVASAAPCPDPAPDGVHGPGEPSTGGDDPGPGPGGGAEDTRPAGPGEGGGGASPGRAADEPADCTPAGPAAPATGEPGPEPAQQPPPAYPGAQTSAATLRNWGEPNKVDDFDGELRGWNMYDGEGHAGQGRRSPEAISTKDGLLTINGDAQGTTGGMAWTEGSQKYGRWEGRVRAPASDPSYNALLLLWPTAENFPVGGEVDFMEMTDHTRQTTELFLHYGEDNSQVQGKVAIDATQWHNWAVEWTPKGITAFVDGKEWWHTDDTSILPPGPMHLTVQLDWFPQGEGEVKPSQMQVDWVRQYPLPETEPGGGQAAGGGEEGLLDGLPGRLTEGAPDAG